VEDEDGAVWMQVSGDGTPSSQQSEPTYLLKLASLEQKLEDVKTAFCVKHDYAISLAGLEAKLGEVESLYCKKYAEELCDTEDEAEEDEDGALWEHISGDCTLTSQRLELPYLLKLANLEQKLEEVKIACLENDLGEIKCLFYEKYGEELLDSEGKAVEDEDGAMWMQVSGDGASSFQQFELTYCLNLASLEQKLDDVKTAYLETKLGEIKRLYLEKYGEELLDSEDEAVEVEDGAMWVHVSGEGTSSFQQFELTYRLNLASLEQKLGDVKNAYSSKYSYANNLAGLEAKLGEIESLFAKKYGDELEDTEGQVEEDEDGAHWLQVSGDGTANSQQLEPAYLVKLASLEQKLEDVQTAYCSKYGFKVDAETITGSEQDGYASHMTSLEAKLGEVELLFAKKYGQEMQDAAGEEGEDEDGALWTEVSGKWTGSSQEFEPHYLVKLASLEQKLEDVKIAYCSNYGRNVDADEVVVSNRG